MSEGTTSARRILDAMGVDEPEHPADQDQGRALDPASHRRGLFSPIVDGFMYCVIRMAEALMSDQDAQPAKPLKAKPLPDLEHREAASFFEGWWLGNGVGFVIGAGVSVIFIKHYLGLI